jgi:hypothetical protein
MPFSNRMTFPITALMGCVTCALVPGNTSALPANELFQSCEVIDQTVKADSGGRVDISAAGLPCWYYISAVQNMTSLKDESDGRLLHICPPSNTTVLDLVRVFVRHAREVKPSALGVENAAPLVFTALLKAYPCDERP